MMRSIGKSHVYDAGRRIREFDKPKGTFHQFAMNMEASGSIVGLVRLHD